MIQMQSCSIKRYLQILRFQSLLCILLTSQEEKRLGGESECLEAKRGRKCLSRNKKQNKCQCLSKWKSQCETEQHNAFYLLMGLYSGTTLGVLPHCETCGCTLPISSNVVWLYLHQNAHPTKGTNMKCLNMFHLIINPNDQIICFTVLHFYWAFFERRKKKKQRQSCSSLPHENAHLGGHWDCLCILVFAGSSCIFAKCFEIYQEHYPTSLVLGVNVKPLIITIMILRNCVSLFLLKIKVYTAVTLACLSRSVNVYIHWSTSANPYEHKPNVMLIMYFMWVVFWMSNRDLSL